MSLKFDNASLIDNNTEVLVRYKMLKDKIKDLVYTFFTPEKYRTLGYKLSSSAEPLAYDDNRIRRYAFSKKDNPRDKIAFIHEKYYYKEYQFSNFSKSIYNITSCDVYISANAFMSKLINCIYLKLMEIYDNDTDEVDERLNRLRRQIYWYSGRNGVKILTWRMATLNTYGNGPLSLKEYVDHWATIPNDIEMCVFNIMSEYNIDVSIDHNMNEPENQSCYIRHLNYENITMFYHILDLLMR